MITFTLFGVGRLYFLHQIIQGLVSIDANIERFHQTSEGEKTLKRETS